MKRVVKKPFPPNPEVQVPADLGRAIASARSQTGMTQEEAALFCGVSKQTFVGIEQGRPGTAIGSVLAVASQFGVSVMVMPRSVSQIARESLKKLLSEDSHAA